MRDFVIVTDSCCDMTAEMAKELELEVLPLSLNMDDQVYHNWLDGREIGFGEFYKKLRDGALATTSAIRCHTSNGDGLFFFQQPATPQIISKKP